MNLRTLALILVTGFCGTVIGRLTHPVPEDDKSAAKSKPILLSTAAAMTDCSAFGSPSDRDRLVRSPSLESGADFSDDRFERERQSFLRALIDDPDAAFSQLDVRTDERDLFMQPVTKWAQSNLEAAMRRLDAENTATDVRAALLAGIVEADFHKAVGWLRSHSYTDEPRTDLELYRAVLPQLLSRDAGEAAQLIAELGERAPLDGIQLVTQNLGARDAQPAFEWVQKLERRSDHEQAQLLQAVSAGLVTVNPGAATAHLDRTTDPSIRGALLREISSFKARSDIRDAWTWLGRYSTDGSYRETARALLGQWSYAKPREVAEIVSSISEPELQRSAAEQLASVWREIDRNAFREWVLGLPSAPLRAQLLAAERTPVS